MSTYRKIQIALGTILLWSSTSVSSFAATNTITPGNFQSVTVKIPVESVPSRQLNLTQDSNLIAQSIRSMLSQLPGGYDTFKMFDEIWKNRVDRQKRFFDYCNSQKNLAVDDCFDFLLFWTNDLYSYENARNLRRQDFDDLRNINIAIMDMEKKP